MLEDIPLRHLKVVIEAELLQFGNSTRDVTFPDLLVFRLEIK